MRGFADLGLDASSQNTTFNMGSFNPILLWRQGERFLFESELEMAYMNNQFSLGLGYANASFFVAKGLTIKAGKLLIPFGTFGEKMHPSWVNKLATAPLGAGHDGILPMADFGVEVRGGLQLGYAKLSYSLYAVNGPQIKDGVEEPNEAGMLLFENPVDNNKNKAVGSRISVLPFSNSSLEIGLSGYYAMPGIDHSPFEGDSLNKDLSYKKVKALLYAVDLSYVKLLGSIGGIVDIKGQYSVSDVSKAVYYNASDTSRYDFVNKSSAYYVQVAYRPAFAGNKILKNLEAVGRYSVYNTPKGARWFNNQTQITFGINYWLTWRTVIKADYQITDDSMSGMTGMAGMANTNGNMFLLHLAMGF